MPRIAVITPYFKEPLALLEECHRSVQAQGLEVDHFLVADGHPRAELNAWKARHVTLPTAHGDAGGTARGIGGVLAAAEGYDFVTYLDADNWYHPGHLASLLDLHRQTNAPVCSAWRTFHRPDGSALAITEPGEDGFHHIDTNCFFLHRPAFGVLDAWLKTPRPLAPIGDRVFLGAVRHARLPIAPTRQRTLAYRTTHEYHYRLANEPAPPGAKPMDFVHPAQQWLLTREGVHESVAALGFWPGSYTTA